MRTDEIMDALLAVWRHEAEKAGGLPPRGAITPARLGGRLLPHVALVDVVAGPSIDFRYRLVGEMLKTAFGASLTGDLHSTLVKAPFTRPKPVREAYERCVATRAPTQVDHTFRTAHDTPKRLRGIICPLSEDGQTVTTMVLAGSFEELPLQALAETSSSDSIGAK